MKKCSKCGRKVVETEFDDDFDECYYCLFPEASNKRPVPIDHSHGYDKNEPNQDIRYVLDNLIRIPVENKREKHLTEKDKRILRELRKNR